jgi:mannose/fructose/N-acetylgalactosamine-specific phosphotransferase system component IIC
VLVLVLEDALESLIRGSGQTMAYLGAKSLGGMMIPKVQRPGALITHLDVSKE